MDDTQVERLVVRLVQHEVELRKTMEQALQAKMESEAKELARRLDTLNNHQARLESDREMFVNKGAFAPWQQGVDKWIAHQDGARRGIAIAWAVFWVVFGGIAMIVAFLK